MSKCSLALQPASGGCKAVCYSWQCTEAPQIVQASPAPLLDAEAIQASALQADLQAATLGSLQPLSAKLWEGEAADAAVPAVSDAASPPSSASSQTSAPDVTTGVDSCYTCAFGQQPSLGNSVHATAYLLLV